MTTSGTMNDSKWQRLTTSGTTNGNEWKQKKPNESDFSFQNEIIMQCNNYNIFRNVFLKI